MAHRLKVAGIVVFLLVDVVLVVYLMGQMRADRYQGGGVDLDQLSTSPSPEQADPVGSVSLIQGKGALMRVTAGSCSKEGRPQLEVSTDGGESFDEMAVPVLAGSEELRPPTVRTIMTATAKSPKSSAWSRAMTTANRPSTTRPTEARAGRRPTRSASGT